MMLSDCVKCWETPCVCGHGYRDWSKERRLVLIKAIMEAGEDKITVEDIKSD